MAIGPTPLPSQISSFQATRAKIGPFFALAGVATAAWFMKESYEGHKDIWKASAANHHTQAEYEYMQEGWGHKTGYPVFEHLEHKLKGWLIFGPHGFKTHYNEGHAISNGFKNDVIYANLFPILLAIASIYLGFGAKTVNGKILQAFRAIKPKGTTGANISSNVGKAASGVARAGGKGLKGIGSLFTGGRAPFTLIALAFGLYTIHLFRHVWTHGAQEDMFRGFIHGSGH